MNIGLLFGGRSVEHDVSIVSAQIVMKGFRELPQFSLIPIYITPLGRWVVYDAVPSMEVLKKAKHEKDTWKLVLDAEPGKLILEKGGVLKKNIAIDVAFPMVHGTNGEDGTLQGLLEMIKVPYAGCGVVASAMGMDKVHMKQVFQAADLPIVPHLWFLRSEFEKNPEKILEYIEKELDYPLFVKPANLGSSIGITKATDRESLKNALEVAAHYDRKIIVERGVADVMEINCAVMGNESPIASVLEQPVSHREFLSFEEKYLTKGGTMKGIKSKVKIPAPLSPGKTKEIQDLAIKAYRALDCSGIARVDFLIERSLGLAGPKQSEINEEGRIPRSSGGELAGETAGVPRNEYTVFVNEINTMPGSLQQHLWKASGVPLSKLIEQLIEFAIEKYKDRQRNMTFYRSNLI